MCKANEKPISKPRHDLIIMTEKHIKLNLKNINLQRETVKYFQMMLNTWILEK